MQLYQFSPFTRIFNVLLALCCDLFASNTLLVEVQVGKTEVLGVKPLKELKGFVPFWSGGVLYFALTALSCLCSSSYIFLSLFCFNLMYVCILLRTLKHEYFYNWVMKLWPINGHLKILLKRHFLAMFFNVCFCNLYALGICNGHWGLIPQSGCVNCKAFLCTF